MSNANETQEVQYHIDELYRRLARIQGELAALRFTLAVTVAKSGFHQGVVDQLEKAIEDQPLLEGLHRVAEPSEREALEAIPKTLQEMRDNILDVLK